MDATSIPRLAFALIAATPFSSSSAVAQAAAPPVPAIPCELHIWPARVASTSGDLAYMALSMAANSTDNANASALLDASLDPPGQIAAILPIDLVSAFNLPTGTAIVSHDLPLLTSTNDNTETRRSNSTASCYYELIVTNVVYTVNAGLNREISADFSFRQFGAGQTLLFRHRGWKEQPLSLFPPSGNDNAIRAIDNLTVSFREALEDFAADTRRRIERRTSRR